MKGTSGEVKQQLTQYRYLEIAESSSGYFYLPPIISAMISATRLTQSRLILMLSGSRLSSTS